MNCNLFNGQRKAQMTVFIIVALVILVVGGIVMMYGKTLRDEPLQPADIASVTAFVETCMEQTAMQGLSLLGIQGGRINLPNVAETGYSGNYLSTGFADVVYGYYNENNVLVKINDMADELSVYIDSAIDDCINNFAAFKQGNVTAGSHFTAVTIAENEVIVDMKYPVELFRAEVNEFAVEVPVRLGYIHSIADDIIEKQAENEQVIDMTYLSEFDVGVSVLPVDKNSFMYVINDSDYVFMTAVGLIENTAPEMIIEDVIRIKEGTQFSYKMVVIDDDDDDEIQFEDDTSLFDISDKGLIRFFAAIPGEYDVMLTVIDPAGNYDIKNVKFIVEESVE